MLDFTIIAITNISLFIGFIYIAFAVLPRFEIKNQLTRISGISFFVMGAAIRFPVVINAIMGHDASSTLTSGPIAVIQAVMAIAVWLFIIGLHQQKKAEQPVGFVTESTKKLHDEVDKLKYELDKKDSELSNYQKERFTRSLSEMQTRVEELNKIVKDTEGKL